MSTTIKEFLVGLGFKVDEAQLKGFEGSILKAGVGVTALGNIVADVAQQLTGALAELFSIGRYADPLDRLMDASERTGMAAQEIARYGYAAQLSGSSVEALIGSLESFSRTAGLAAQGMGRGKQVFEDLGISLKTSNGQIKDTSALLEEVRGKIAGLSSAEQQGLLQRLGLDPALFNLLTQDMNGLFSEFDEMVAKSGISFEQASADAATYNDELDKLRFSVNLIGQAAAARLFGGLSDATLRLRRMITENMPRIISAIEKVVNVLLYVGRVFGTIFNRVVSIVTGVVDWLVKLDEATNGWLSTIGLAVIAWRAFNASMLATPLGMILALSAAIAALVEDFYVWSQGGESLINWERWAPGINSAIEAVYELKDLFTGLFTAIFAGIDLVISLLTGDFTSAWNAVKELVLNIIEVFSRAFGFIGKIVGAVRGISAGFSSDAPLLAPSPAAATALNGAVQTVTQETNINVQAPDPATAGRVVAAEQRGVNAEMTRNLAPRAR